MTRYDDLPQDELGFRDRVAYHALKRWRLVVAGCLGLLALAFLAWNLIGRREEPRVDMPLISVRLVYPGASSEDVERQVVKPVEETLYGMEGVKDVESTSMPGMASMLLRFEDDVNLDVAMEKVRGRILGCRTDLPDEVKEPELVIESTTLVPMMLVAVTGMAPEERLGQEARRLKTELLTVPGVAGIDLKGEQPPAVRVRLDPLRLAAHGLSAAQVAQALRVANLRVPGGEYLVDGQRTLLQVNRSFSGVDSVRQVPVGSSLDARGAVQTVRLGEVAQVTDATLTPHERFIAKGQPAVALAIRFRGDADAVRVGQALREKVPLLARSLPAGLGLSILHDQPRLITRSVDSFVSSLLEGMALVLLVVSLGMGWRPALVVSGVIPLAAGGAVLGLMLLGFSLEMVSIAGLIVALGLLVDDAVVATESIQLMREKGLGGFRAAVLGTARVFWPNNGTTAVAFASFLPLFFMGGDVGSFILGLPTAVLIALGTSLLVAQVVTPWLSTRLLRPRKGVAELPDHAPYDRREDHCGAAAEESSPLMGPVRRLFDRWMPRVLARPGRVALGAALLLAGACALFPVIGLQFFPKSDKPFVFVTVEMPRGTALAETQRKVQEVMALVQRDGAVAELSAVAGGSYPAIVSDRVSVGSGEHLGDVLVRLHEGGNSTALASRLRGALGAVAGARISVGEIWMGPPVSHPVVVRVHGDDYARLRAIAAEVKGRLARISGTVNIQDSLTDAVPLTEVELDLDRALSRGLDPAAAGETLRWLYGEDKVTEFRRGEDRVQVVLEGPSEPGRAFGGLEDTPLPSVRGRLVSLREAGQARVGFGLASLQRRNGQRIVEITADVDAATLPGKVLGELDPWLKARAWESGYGFAYGGEEEEVGKSFRNLAVAALGSLILIAALLLLMLDDFVLAGITVLLVPFSLIGGLLGLVITGHPFGFMSFLGLLALMGVFVNHKIYYLDRLQELLRRGLPLEAALLQAGRDRLRPVVLTALTAVLGLLPLTLFGGPLWGGFGWVNIFGLLASIPLSLLVLPAFVLLARRWGGRWARSARTSGEALPSCEENHP